MRLVGNVVFITFVGNMKRLLKHISFFFILFAILFTYSSCEEEQTYAKQKEREKENISNFIANGVCIVEPIINDTLLYVKPIKVISESQFIQQDSCTDIEKNEYVVFPASGIYMQIVRKGTGDKLTEGTRASILCRYIEYNIASDTIQTSNMINILDVKYPDKMVCENNSGSISGTFVTSKGVPGVMQSTYSSTSVPEGWLVPLRYVNIGRKDSPDARIAKVRIIVPHTMGHINASANVYPCFYEITYQKGLY